MDKTAHIARLVLPGHTNRHGSLFGGIALSLMDEAAGIVSTRVARGPVVTAHIASVDFKAPIWQGEAVLITAALVSAGTSSMKIRVETWGECLEKGTKRHCTTADFVMVAIDQHGRPRPIPKEARADIEAARAAGGSADGDEGA